MCKVEECSSKQEGYQGRLNFANSKFANFPRKFFTAEMVPTRDYSAGHPVSDRKKSEYPAYPARHAG